jgi:hypothetical protein
VYRLFLLAAYAAGLAAFNVMMHIDARGGVAFFREREWSVHRLILAHDMGAPWSYRLLSEWMLEGIVSTCAVIGVGDPIVTGSIALRFCQGVVIFFLAYGFYRGLGLSVAASLFGLSAISLAMSQALYESGFQFNTYGDVIFYLLAGLCMIRGRAWMLCPIAFVAAMNRETSGLIACMPLMLLRPPVTSDQVYRVGRLAACVGICWLIGFGAVRWLVGPRPVIVPYGLSMGRPMLEYNLGRWLTYERMFATLGVTPLLAGFGWRAAGWPLRILLLLLPIPWIATHFVMAIAAETRLFLVPFVLVLLPATLIAVGGRNQR